MCWHWLQLYNPQQLSPPPKRQQQQFSKTTLHFLRPRPRLRQRCFFHHYNPQNSSKQLEPAPVLPNLAHLAHAAHAALVLGVVLGPVKRALLKRRAAVDGRVAGRAHLELGKLVKLNLDRVVRVALALRLGLFGLCIPSVHCCQSQKERRKHTLSRILAAPPLASIRLAKLSAEL